MLLHLKLDSRKDKSPATIFDIRDKATELRKLLQESYPELKINVVSFIGEIAIARFMEQYKVDVAISYNSNTAILYTYDELLLQQAAIMI